MKERKENNAKFQSLCRMDCHYPYTIPLYILGRLPLPLFVLCMTYQTLDEIV